MEITAAIIENPGELVESVVDPETDIISVEITQAAEIIEASVEPETVISTVITGDLTTLGGGDYYVHTQVSPLTVWTIVHNLNKYPSVTVVDSGGTVVVGDVRYLNANSITVTFSAGFSGKAYLN